MALDFLSYILIPAYTLLFTRGYDWFTTNFSVIGNMFHRKDAFVLWGILVGCYYFVVLRTLTRNMPQRPKGTFLVPAALFLLVCGITTPYLPDQLPLKSFLHIVFAFLAAVFLLLFLFLAVWKLYQLSPTEYRSYLAVLVLIVVVCMILLVIAGIISSALELFFTISTVIVSRRLLKKVLAEKEGEDEPKEAV